MIAILPWGATEQHGPILPVNTDTVIASYIARKLSEKIKDSVVLDALPYGVSKEHMGFSGTVSLDYRTASWMLEDIFESICENNPEYEFVVIINGHGGNQEVASLVCQNFNYRSENVKFAAFHVFPEETRKLAKKLFGAFSAHADSVETSVMAAITGEIQEGIYDLEKWNVRKSLPHVMKLYPVIRHSKSGIVSKTDFLEANTRKGEEIIESSVSCILREILEYQETIHILQHTQ